MTSALPPPDDPWAAPRPFRASIVAAAGSFFVVLDELQPLALVISTDGATEVVSWPSTPSPKALDWPWRAARGDGSSILVEDGVGTRPILLRPTSSGCEVVVDPGPADGRDDERSVLRTRFAMHRTMKADAGGTWRASTLTEGPRWSAQVEFDGVSPTPSRTWLLGPGSVTGFAAIGHRALVVVRRAAKRPWRFRPRVDLALLHPHDAEPRWLRPAAAGDVREHCWPVAQHDPEAIPRAVRSALGDARAAMADGARDVGVDVAGIEGFPAVRLRFRHPRRPEVLCVREDEPFTDLGLSFGGLLGLTIYLEEDLSARFLPPWEDARDGILRI